MRRRQGARSEEYPQRSLSDEQRSRRLIFGETLWTEALLSLGFVAPRFQIFQICSLVASRVRGTKISLSGRLQNFLICSNVVSFPLPTSSGFTLTQWRSTTALTLRLDV